MNRDMYSEELSSVKTQALFVLLTLVFFSLFGLSLSINHWGGWTVTFLCISLFFFSYILNYRTLKISIKPDSLKLTFGIIIWTIPINNIEDCYRDEDTFRRFGGAGIHFMFVNRKYRAFFNFLEYPRVVILLKEKKGRVQEIAFTTKHPEQVMDLLKNSDN